HAGDLVLRPLALGIATLSLSSCAASWPRDLGSHDLDKQPIADHPRLGYLADALDGADKADVADLMRHRGLTWTKAPDPSQLLQSLYDTHQALPPLDDDAVQLRVITYNVGLLDRPYMGTRVTVPHGEARRKAMLKALFESDANVLLLQEMWEWTHAQEFGAAAEAAGWTWYAGTEKLHLQHGLFLAVRDQAISGELSGEEHQFRAQRKLEHWPGPNVRRGWLHAQFQLAGTQQTVHLIDLHATSYPQFWPVRNMQARQVGLSLSELPQDDIVVLGGDLNAGPFYAEDVWIDNEGEEVAQWWLNAPAWALWQHYGDMVDAHALSQVPADVTAGRALPTNPAQDHAQPYGSATWCKTVAPDVFTGTECNSHYMAQYVGTEFPARLDHILLRDRDHHVRVQQSTVVFDERHDLGADAPIEWSDHYGLRVELRVK
ncbi:MAG: endonuclease/exonuclease/phosphatase family metal-dependent hydrolase, partial [Kiritimatiellia bacterium]